MATRGDPDARLAIGGRGAKEDNSAELHALTQRLGLSDRVLFVGAKNPDQVALWLGAADLFVLASDFEGYSGEVWHHAFDVTNLRGDDRPPAGHGFQDHTIR
jgi:glycosyltransferase involved in cell wall biosynthesis